MSTVPLSLDQIYELAFNTLKANGCDDENAKILSTLITNAEEMDQCLMDCLDFLLMYQV